MSRSRSPQASTAISDVSDDDAPDALAATSRSISRPETPPAPPEPPAASGTSTDDIKACQWNECGVVFAHLPSMISHIHADHIGVHKSNYTCEWTTCPRRGLAQTSRFALISHIRSHTGEKPFTCPRPECDKSFTRSDALAKHMRLQHNISPPAPGRGGSRKRKRPEEIVFTPANIPTPPPPGTTHVDGGGFNTFRVEPRATSEPLDDEEFRVFRESNGYRSHGSGSRSPSPTAPPRSFLPDKNDPNNPDVLSSRLMQHYNPQTNLILGRTPEQTMYIVMKAKYQDALEQHENLKEELRNTREELARETEAKEIAVDRTLSHFFGPEAEQFILPIQLPVPRSRLSEDTDIEKLLLS